MWHAKSVLNYSAAGARNQQPIYQALLPYLKDIRSVLEIGSGSGQHGLYFSQRCADIKWQCSDTGAWLEPLQQNISSSALKNLLPAIALDVNTVWPKQCYDMLYTANSLHIMDWQSVERFFSKIASHLNAQALFCCYGPFKYHNEFTSQTNQTFDLWLKNRNDSSGIRDIEAIATLASEQHLSLLEDISMPANNQLLIWKKSR